MVVRLEDAVIERGDFTLGPLTLEVAWGDRVALSGPNGFGQDHARRALIGRLPLPRWGTDASVPAWWWASWSKTAGPWTCPASGVAMFIAGHRLARDRARSQLAKFGLGAEAVTRPSSSLSPGERTRAQLAVLRRSGGVNFLVLDEPTNHLDLPAIEQLESALAGVRRDAPAGFTRPTSPPDGTITRSVELPGRHDDSRGPRKA